MKVNDPNVSSLASTEASRTQGAAARTAGTGRPADAPGTGSVAGDDVHLSELVRSLRALASESPERQAHLEELARAYANGTYKMDAEATAAKIIDDALQG